jgi:Domain of unknown function (DUF4328)
MDCPQCGVHNEPANVTCVRCGTALPATSSARGAAAMPARRVFRDPKRLTQWAQWLLITVAVLDLVLGASEFAQHQLLMRMRDGGFSSDAEMMSAAEANDLRHGLISIAAILLYIGTVVVFSMWVYRASANLHALGSPGLRFTPGWAVGWYFVPIANLWKPYQAMKEIWRASKNPSNWQAEITSPLLGWWWFWWIVSSIAANVSGRMTFRAESLDEMIATGPLNITALVLELIGVFFAVKVVKRIGGFQAMAADRSLSAVFA